MTERPILFNAPMVRAILAGTKTQTRRAIKFKPWHQIEEREDGSPWPWMYDGERDADHWLPCPYGQTGDTLWVRETWMADPPIDSTWPSTAFNGCRPRDHSLIPDTYRKPEHCLYRADGHDLHGWTPAIHMYRWASRITLEITGVRVERLQEISEADALAEGVAGHPDGPWHAYRSLWTFINGPGSWEANPWVWVVEFRAAPKDAG